MLDDRVTRHVVFVHGLNGSFDETWLSSQDTPECWPDWLDRDDGAIAVWGVNYGAAIHGLQDKTSMALPDRGASLLPALLQAPELGSGSIILVGYSLGGLVVKQVLRRANDQKGSSAAAGSFVRRVRRVAFIATPHQGSDLARTARVMGRLRRETVLGLKRNDPHLRDLNNWYRGYCDQNPVETLALWENENSSLSLTIVPGIEIPIPIGHIVKPDSANPGVARCNDFPIDADHFSIVRPTGRDAQTFEHLKEFIERPFPEETPGAPLPPTDFGASGALPGNSPRVSAKLFDRIDELRKSRYAIEFEAEASCTSLMSSMGDEYFLASPKAKQAAAAWCARIVAASNSELATAWLDQAVSMGASEETQLAEAFLILFRDSDEQQALSHIRSLDSSAALTARLVIASHAKPPVEALQRIAELEIDFECLDSDGKYQLIQRELGAERWDAALRHVKALDEADFDRTPVLLTLAGAVLVTSTLNSEFRARAFSNHPSHVLGLPVFDDADSIERRAEARQHFIRGAETLSRLGRTRMAHFASDYALWLGIIDDHTKESALHELRQSMADQNHALRRLPFALHYGLDVDLTGIELEIEASEREGAFTEDTAVARIAIAHDKAKTSPSEAASYIERNAARLAAFFRPEWVKFVEIDLVIKSGDLERARDLLDPVSADLPDELRQSLEQSMAEIRGEDPVAMLEREYADSQSTTGLLRLVATLRDQSAWSKLARYAGKLFEATRDRGSLETYVNALHMVGDDSSIVELSMSVPEMFSSDLLNLTLAWAYFRLGRLQQTTEHISRCQNDDRSDVTALKINLAVASGDWLSLSQIVEEEWALRATRSASELIQMGMLAQRLASPRAEGLIRAAAAKADGDPELLVACYSAATGAGWEDDSEVHGWLDSAIRSSDDGDGPIQRVDIKELLDGQPEWRDRTERVWDELATGKLPIFAAAHALRRSMFDLFVTPALSNLAEADPRRRQIIHAFSGGRPLQEVDATNIALDASTILTLGFLGHLERAINLFDVVWVSHSLLGWLFEERQRIQFHQPSRVRAAQDLKDLVDDGLIDQLSADVGVDQTLEAEVGTDLALLLTAAAAQDDDIQAFVVRPYPVPKHGTLLEENADLSEHASTLVSCGDVVVALRSAGQLTSAEEEAASNYLKMHEQEWPDSPSIRPGSTLYLDSLAITYLQHVNLLDRIQPAGFRVVVCASDIADAEALIRQQTFAARASDLIESVRGILAESIAAQKVRLMPLNETDDVALTHPTATFFDLPSEVDALAVDDRSVNCHLQMTTDAGVTPIYTSLDLIHAMSASGSLSDLELRETTAILRGAGFIFTNLSEQELTHLVAEANVVDGVLSETAELRVIRETLLRIRMADVLQLPTEAHWISEVLQTVTNCIRAQWTGNPSVEGARAKSDWLISHLDIRGWAHRTLFEDTQLSRKFRSQLLILTYLPAHSGFQHKDEYWAWLEEQLLLPLRDRNPDEFSALLADAAEYIDSILENLDAEGAA